MKKIFLSFMVFGLALTCLIAPISAQVDDVIKKNSLSVLDVDLSKSNNFSFSTIDYTKYNVINFEWTHSYIPNSDVAMGTMQHYIYELIPEIIAANGLNATYTGNKTITFKFNIKFTIDAQGTIMQDSNYSYYFQNALLQTSMANLVGNKIIIING